LLLQDARREARVDAQRDIVLLSDQDRSLWDQAQIREGAALVDRALRGGPAGPYALQAAIAALHAQAPSSQATDWAQIAALYGLLMRAAPSPVVTLNRAVAVAMSEGPQAGLSLLDGLSSSGELGDHHLLHAARADLLARVGETEPAREAYGRALAVTANAAERRLLERKLAALHPRG
jgi:RNA polymerase sigma-70 factor (ECF subfamily)